MHNTLIEFVLSLQDAAEAPAEKIEAVEARLVRPVDECLQLNTRQLNHMACSGWGRCQHTEGSSVRMTATNTIISNRIR